VLGRQLRGLRERAGISREQAADLLHVAPATIRRMETAEVALKIPYVQMLLPAYGLPDEDVGAFLRLTGEANEPGWWQRYHDVLPEWFGGYVSLEESAQTIRSYEPHFVPGLLQTEDYAREVLTAGSVGRNAPDSVDGHVALRLERQAMLRKPGAPVFWVVMDETVLLRPVGSPAVMRAQFDRLLDASELPNVTLQIAELSSGHHPGTYSPFVLLRFAVPEVPDMVYVEYLTGAIYLDQPEEVQEHKETMDRMVVHAESAKRSRDILARLRRGV
jgi:transcriptional regulator with XRE-family HTH domain